MPLSNAPWRQPVPPGAFVEACALDVGAWPEVHDLPAHSNAVAQRVPRAWSQRAGDGCLTSGPFGELGNFPGIFEAERDGFELPPTFGARTAAQHCEFGVGVGCHSHSVALAARANKPVFHLPDRRGTLSMVPVLCTAKRSSERGGWCKSLIGHDLNRSRTRVHKNRAKTMFRVLV